jgi:hypothetical protein
MKTSEGLRLPGGGLEHPAMDYAFLRQEGIEHLERMVGHLWTDFNAHDPGITILEQICYAITDLAYRISHEIPDLLAGGSDDPHRSLYSPATILTSEPVTLTDLRKLVLDVDGVRNAWIEGVEEPRIALHYHEGKRELSLEDDTPYTEPVWVKGLYRVAIETSDLAGRRGTDVHRDVVRRLHAHRPLCADFEEIRVLEPQDVQVQAAIEIGPVDDADSVLLEIYHGISDYFSPAIHFASLQEMLSAGKRIDEIFDGPVLNHGFIDSEILRQSVRRTEIHTSDLIQIIMDVPGVKAVRHIAVSAGGEAQAWRLVLDSMRAPRLDLEKSTITLVRENLTAGLNVESVIKAYWERRKRSAVAPTLPLDERDILPPRGRDRNVESYHSIQHQFPALYGIGEMGLPDSAPAPRKAAARQLKAYLMFFDQLLANYFAQLGHARELFSFHSEIARTYVARMIDDPGLNLDEPDKPLRTRPPDDHRSHLEEIADSTVQAGSPANRKNRFLNHLMARFAEQFTDYSLVLFGAADDGQRSAEDRLVDDKRAFLQRYPRISSARGTGFDYLMPWDSGNTSGLEERIQRKLGLVEDDGERLIMVEHLLLRPIEEDMFQLGGNKLREVPLLAASAYKDPYSQQISFVLPGQAGRLNEAESSGFRQLVERIIREETPAHLIAYIHWLEQDAWEEFKGAYEDWLEKRRSYGAAKHGL